MTPTWKKWLNSFGGQKRAKAPIRRPRLGVEAMEDRVVPATPAEHLTALGGSVTDDAATEYGGWIGNSDTLSDYDLPVIGNSLASVVTGGIQTGFMEAFAKVREGIGDLDDTTDPTGSLRLAAIAEVDPDDPDDDDDSYLKQIGSATAGEVRFQYRTTLANAIAASIASNIDDFGLGASNYLQSLDLSALSGQNLNLNSTLTIEFGSTDLGNGAGAEFFLGGGGLLTGAGFTGTATLGSGTTAELIGSDLALTLTGDATFDAHFEVTVGDAADKFTASEETLTEEEVGGRVVADLSPDSGVTLAAQVSGTVLGVTGAVTWDPSIHFALTDDGFVAPTVGNGGISGIDADSVHFPKKAEVINALLGRAGADGLLNANMFGIDGLSFGNFDMSTVVDNLGALQDAFGYIQLLYGQGFSTDNIGELLGDDGGVMGDAEGAQEVDDADANGFVFNEDALLQYALGNTAVDLVTYHYEGDGPSFEKDVSFNFATIPIYEIYYIRVGATAGFDFTTHYSIDLGLNTRDGVYFNTAETNFTAEADGGASLDVTGALFDIDELENGRGKFGIAGNAYSTLSLTDDNADGRVYLKELVPSIGTSDPLGDLGDYLKDIFTLSYGLDAGFVVTIQHQTASGVLADLIPPEIRGPLGEFAEKSGIPRLFQSVRNLGGAFVSGLSDAAESAGNGDVKGVLTGLGNAITGGAFGGDDGGGSDLASALGRGDVSDIMIAIARRLNDEIFGEAIREQEIDPNSEPPIPDPYTDVPEDVQTLFTGANTNNPNYDPDYDFSGLVKRKDSFGGLEGEYDTVALTYVFPLDTGVHSKTYDDLVNASGGEAENPPPPYILAELSDDGTTLTLTPNDFYEGYEDFDYSIELQDAGNGQVRLVRTTLVDGVTHVDPVGTYEVVDGFNVDMSTLNGDDKLQVDAALNFPVYADLGFGDNYARTGAGDDTVYTGSGSDTLYGGSGDDLLSAGDGTNFVYGQGGDDVLYGGDDKDYLYGGADNDWLLGGGGNDEVWGGAGDDHIGGDAGNDFLNGEGGADSIYGGTGADVINGGTGDDTIDGEDDNDSIYWKIGNGADRVRGGGGVDVFVFEGTTGADAVRMTPLGAATGFTPLSNPSDGTVVFDQVEVPVFLAYAGVDTITVDDLTGTDVVVPCFNLGDADGAVDSITFAGTQGADQALFEYFDLEPQTGLQRLVNVATTADRGALVSNFETARDTVTYLAAGGADSITVNHWRGALTVDGGSGDDTVTVQGEPGPAVRQVSADILGPTSTRVVYDPSSTAVPLPPAPGAGSWTIVLTDVDTFNELTAADRLDVRVRSSLNSVTTIGDGADVNGDRTTAITGPIPTVQFAHKTTAGVSGWTGADTFVVDNPNAGTDLIRLDLYGHVNPAAAPITGSTDDNAADVFNVRATGVAVALYGQGGNDTFNLFPGTGVTTANVAVDGGAGTDTVSYAGFATARGVALTGLGGTDGFAGTEASGTFTNVNTLTGGASSADTLTGLDAAATWLLAPAGETYTAGGRTLAFAAFETLAGGADVDTFNVRVVPAARTLNGRGGDDEFNVSSDAPNHAGDLAGITSLVTIDAGAGAANRLTVSNFGGPATSTAVLTDAELSGFAPAAIRYAATGGSFTAAGGSGIVIRGSNAGDDGLNVRSTLAGSTTRVEGNGGDDTIIVASDAPGIAGNLDRVAGALSVDGGAGADALTVSDFSSATANANARIGAAAITGLAGPTDAVAINYAGFAELAVRGSNTSGDRFTVASPDAVLTLTTEGGDDTVRVESLTRTADIDTGAGSDLVVVASPVGSLAGIQAALSVDGGSGDDDRLVADDSGTAAGQGYTLSATVLTRTGAANLTYANIDRMEVYGSAGVNTYDVTATGATVSTLVSDGGAGSHFTVQGDGLQAANTFRGNGGTEQFVLNAGLGFSGTALRVSGGAGADDLDVNARVGNDVVTIRVTDTTGAGTLAGLGLTADFDTLERIDLDGRGGRNTLNWVDDTNQVFGTALTPETGIVVRPLGAASGDVRLGLAETSYPTVAFVNVGGDFTVSGDGDGSGDKDVVTVLAASTAGLGTGWGELVTAGGVDAIDVTDRRVTITNQAAGELRSVALADAGSSPTVSTLYVRGGAEARPFGDNVTAAPSARLNLLLDGMDPTSGRPGDNLKVSWVGSRSLAKSRDPLLGPDHARFVQDSDGASVGFQRFEKVYDTQVALTGTGPGTETHVIISDPTTGGVRYADKVPFPGFFGGVTVASADINGDSVADVVVGAGNGGGPVVVVYDGIEGFEVARFAAYEESFRGGVVVSAADVDGDGYSDVVTGTGVSGGPRVIVLSGKDQSVLANFFAYESTFRDGVQVAAGDTNGDGFADILTGTGRGGAPRVVLFDGVTNQVRADFFAFDSNARFGVSVGLGDLDGDFISDLVVGDGSATEPHVRAFRGRDAGLLADFMVNDPFAPAAIPVIDRESGVRVGATDLDGDGIADILAGKGQGTRPVVRGYKVATVDPVTKKVSVGLSENYRETMFDPGVYGWGIEVGGSD